MMLFISINYFNNNKKMLFMNGVLKNEIYEMKFYDESILQQKENQNFTYKTIK